MIPVSGQRIDHLRSRCNGSVNSATSTQSPGKQVRHKEHGLGFQTLPLFCHQLEQGVDIHNLIAGRHVQLFR